MTYGLEVERRARGQITIVIAKGAQMTYKLEVEREGKRSDHSCDCKRSRDNVLPGGGEGGEEVRSWLQLQREQG